MPSGVLTIDKPRGMTSHDVVAAVRRLLGTRAVGHTGTLDPDASGLLILCIGPATRFARFFEILDKVYWTVLQLGVCTTTQDATGEMTRQCDVPVFTPQQITAVLQRFQGVLQQIPPMYSAVKYHGQRLYHLARQGQTVTRQAREITVRELLLLDQRPTQLTLSVTCSKGTYIRTLGEDIGLALGCGAHVAHLQRCRVGPFTLHDAYPLALLQEQQHTSDLSQKLIPLTAALSFFPAYPLTATQYAMLCHRQAQGFPAVLKTFPALPPDALGYRLCTPEEGVVAILYRASAERDQPVWKIYMPP